MQKMAGGGGAGARSGTSASGYDGPSAGVRSPETRRSSTVPPAKATTSSPRTSPAWGSSEPGATNVASFMGRDGSRTRRMIGFRCPPLLSIMGSVDVSAIEAAAAATSATYRSFAGATPSVLALLERHLPGSGVYLAHLDRGQFIHRIVDARSGAEYGLRSNQALPLGDAFCSHMADDSGPRRCGEIARAPAYRKLAMQQRVNARSYLGVPL